MGTADVSFSAYHASRQMEHSIPALTAMWPIFNEKSEDPAMIKHAMDLIRNTTTYLNGPQPPILCGDQPVYAVIKTIQWNWPELYGEDRYVALLGPLHIEKAFLRVLGQLLENSGWVSVIDDSGIATAGSAEGFLKVS